MPPGFIEPCLPSPADRPHCKAAHPRSSSKRKRTVIHTIAVSITTKNSAGNKFIRESQKKTAP
jgi:hypothetical protein